MSAKQPEDLLGLVRVENVSGPEQVFTTKGWDTAPAALYGKLLPSFPALRGIALDTCHFAMTYEDLASQRRSPGL